MLLVGDCVEHMKAMEAESIDAIVTDPPYGLRFMGKAWDGFGTPLGFQTWTEQWAREAFRILKPGGHLLAFGGTRMYHRLAAGIEDAGFDIRDTMMWLYGTGFPKSHNLKGEWQGWGTALKPAVEPIVLARKPLIGTVAENVLTHNTGALNIDASRIKTDDNLNGGFYRDSPDEYQAICYGKHKRGGEFRQPAGRWASNILLDDEAAAMLDGQSEGASRFFYVAKASRAERNKGTERNTHPTVKPIALMKYLITLVTPKGGTVLDPFLGSGTSAIAAIEEGISWIGCEREAEYVDIARARIAAAQPGLGLSVQRKGE